MLNSLIGYGNDDAADRAYRVLGVTSNRVEILRLIIAAGEASTAELMAAVGLTRNGVYSHLRVLAAEGIITERRATHPRGSGPITYWQADPGEVSATLDDLSDHLLEAAAATQRLETGG